MSKIINIIDEWEMQKQNKTKQNYRTRGEGNYSEKVRDKWFCLAFKLGFLQVICKASSIFKSNLELVLSIILKERESYESKHAAVECRCLKIWDLLSFLICFLNPNSSVPQFLKLNVNIFFTKLFPKFRKFIFNMVSQVADTW